MKKILCFAILALTTVFISSCGGEKSNIKATGFKAAMVAGIGGINDQSFNQSAWEGMQKLAKEGVSVSFIESQRASDFLPNFEKLIDQDPNIIWGIGFIMKDQIKKAADANPNELFALVDDTFPDGEVPNLIGIVFKAEQSSFLVGYIAGYMTKTNQVGLIIGQESPTMDRFKYGYFAGVEYAAKEQGKNIKIDYQVTESFSDVAKGKGFALKMYSDGADIIFHAAGVVGQGIIEAAKENNLYAIGVDMDQNYMAPDNVITSSLKNVGTAVYEVTNRVIKGEKLGGTTVVMGLAEGGVGIAPTTNKLVPPNILKKTKEVEKKIIDNDIVAPATQSEYQNFLRGL
jgi:basic membrane protein A